jgi:hypothetical protein
MFYVFVAVHERGARQAANAQLAAAKFPAASNDGAACAAGDVK